ncbi:hypothetical protein O181_100275 [Austropuccinia psidii MF-1]|uniref:Retrovirus-related Pol polyprotein from transposon TNT 1-94-like beta-barrel domain-containing protein n=1 Tax=Austropuccinia psidii MF-1 TaxID=1389203 RepID=A0A9Q3JFA3_9BASI|nr:hypothetical protein [Austropuccinia psidii MF-1]
MTSHTNNNFERNQLVLDCGATHHMFNTKEMFIAKITPTHIQISMGDTKSNLKAVNIGTAHILCNKKNIKLENALFVPELKCNLISMLELFKKQIKITKREDMFKLSDDKEEILSGRIINRLMIIEHKKPKNLLTKLGTYPGMKDLATQTKTYWKYSTYRLQPSNVLYAT